MEILGSETDTSKRIGKMGEKEDREKIENFKKLIKTGATVTESMRKAGLSGRKYTALKDAIWADPDLREFRPRPGGSREKEKESPPGAAFTHINDEVDGETIKLLYENVPGIRAELNKIVLRIGKPTLPDMMKQVGQGTGAGISEEKDEIKQPTETEMAEELKRRGYKVVSPPKSADDIWDWVNIETVVEKLKKQGFTVDDGKVTKENVTGIIEEERKKWEEEHDVELETESAAERIDAFKAIVNNAVNQIIGVFSPAIQKYTSEAVKGEKKKQK